jgi:hypothetical protein
MRTLRRASTWRLWVARCECARCAAADSARSSP